MSRQDVYAEVEKLREFCENTTKYIWENPELSGHEDLGVKHYSKLMEDNGFKVTFDEKKPTAFVAEWGEGAPVIVIMGEYDALPGLSQAVSAEKQAVREDGVGHGCGHNMLGSAAAYGAIAVKNELEKEGLKGTIKFFGCPEEETLNGKVEMVHHGMFDGCDIAISWHPMNANMVLQESYLASASCRYYFHGTASHAGFAPQNGRSALDAVEIMNVGANYLREHVVDRTRIHYSTHGDAFAPNIVPPEADSYFYVRAPHISDVKDTLSRLNKCAEGAAMMTETTVDIVLDSGCCEMLSNVAYTDLTQKVLDEIPAIEYTEEELEFAKALQETLNPAMLKAAQKSFEQDGPMFIGTAHRDLWQKNPINASTDSGDVSMIMPMNLITAACWPIGVAPHTWQATACGGSSIGQKAAVWAAKAIAGTAYELVTNEEARKEIIAEFESKKPEDYEPLLGPARL